MTRKSAALAGRGKSAMISREPEAKRARGDEVRRGGHFVRVDREGDPSHLYDATTVVGAFLDDANDAFTVRFRDGHVVGGFSREAWASILDALGEANPALRLFQHAGVSARVDPGAVTRADSDLGIREATGLVIVWRDCGFFDDEDSRVDYTYLQTKSRAEADAMFHAFWEFLTA